MARGRKGRGEGLMGSPQGRRGVLDPRVPSLAIAQIQKLQLIVTAEGTDPVLQRYIMNQEL